MKKRFCFFLLSLFCVSAFFSSCKKDAELIPDNNAPYYNEIPDVLIENYINRLYIDLLGREPLDAEMSTELAALKSTDLSFESRREIIVKLQTDTTFIEGDLSYKIAYYHRQYEVIKVRMLEGASAAQIGEQMGPLAFGIYVDSLNENYVGMANGKQELKKYQDLLDAETEYRDSLITINEVYRRMMFNGIYDIINMNTFNFINASFDNLFFRFPTDYEFYTGYDMVETNTSGILLGQPGQNKGDYLNILISSREFYEGLIIFEYRNLLARYPKTDETATLLENLVLTNNLPLVQQQIMITDEYAHF